VRVRRLLLSPGIGLLAGACVVLVAAAGMEVNERATPPRATHADGPAWRARADIAASTEPDGAELFATLCAACHGRDGEGRGDVFPALAGNRFVTHGDPDAVRAVIVNGRGGMPSWGAVLSEEEVAAVVEYLRSGLGNDDIRRGRTG